MINTYLYRKLALKVEKKKVIYIIYKHTIRGLRHLVFLFHLYHGESKLHVYKMMMPAINEKNTHSRIFLIVQTHWNKESAGQHVAPFGHENPDPETISFSSYYLVMCAPWRSNTYQCYSLWFDPTGVRIYDLPQSRRAR